MQDRTLSQCQHKFTSSNCKACGVYNHPEDPALKTALYDSYLNCSAQKYLKHMRRRKCQPISLTEIHEQTYSLLLSICEKFQYQTETLALGVYVYAKTYAREQKQLAYERFWASASLIVASKAIELDRRVPYLNRYQRYAEQSYNQSQYEAAERLIFGSLNHDIQYTTFISFLNFYLTNGIVFKSDALYPGSLKYLEDDIMVKANDYIKNGEFLKFDPEKLALKIIKEVRGKYRLTQWAAGIRKVSGFKVEQIGDSHKERQRIEILKPINNLHIKKYDKLASSLSINLESFSNTNLMQQKFNSCKKKSEPSTATSSSLTLYKMQSMKENIRKDEQKPHQILSSFQYVETTAPLGALRNQLLNTSIMNIHGSHGIVNMNSSIKRGNGYFVGSVDRIVPLTTFAKRP